MDNKNASYELESSPNFMDCGPLEGPGRIIPVHPL
jgi:hypothetical protein